MLTADLAALPDVLRARLECVACPNPELDGPCWCWTGRLNRNGYGRVWWQGREPVVHRVVYEVLVSPVAPGLLLDHLCRVRRCSNPRHLEPVTPRVNTLRGNAVLFAPLAA